VPCCTSDEPVEVPRARGKRLGLLQLGMVIINELGPPTRDVEFEFLWKSLETSRLRVRADFVDVFNQKRGISLSVASCI
jgi:hypothetical protein